MAGLGAAHALERARAAAGAAPFDWVLFERADYFGGKVRTERVDGFVIEGGPDSFIVEKPWPWSSPASSASPTVCSTPTRTCAGATCSRAAACTSCPRD